MGYPPGHEPISDDEILYRRIPENSVTKPGVEIPFDAFTPNKKYDEDGISFTRAKYSTAEEAARPLDRKTEKRYYILAVKAKDLSRLGIRIKPDSLAGNRGHCVLPQLNAADERSNAVLRWRKSILDSLDPLAIEGPFGPFL